MKQYEKYRDSGIEWLGGVPSHWEFVNAKKYIVKNSGGVWGEDNQKDHLIGHIVLRSTEQTMNGKWKIKDPAIRYLTTNEIERALLKQGDLLITKSSGSKSHIGKTTIVSQEVNDLKCCYSNFMQRIRLSNNLNPVLYWYVFNSDVIKTQVNYLVDSTLSLGNLSQSLIENLKIPVPPIEEQEEITNYLDCKVGILDKLIVKKKKQVELLKENRQAIINDVVSHGLNPDVEFQDTNIEYLGRIPKHWEVTMLKYIGTAKIGAIYAPADMTDNKGILVLRSSNIQNSKLSLENNVYIKQEKVNINHEVKTNDILICSRNGSRHLIGKNILIDQDTLPQGTIYGAFMTVFKSQHNEFLYWIFNTYIFKYYSAMYFTSTINQLTIENLYSLTVPIPSIAEQEEIVKYLDHKTSIIDQLIKEVNKSIELLKEYKSSLISHMVTGKIKV